MTSFECVRLFGWLRDSPGTSALHMLIVENRTSRSGIRCRLRVPDTCDFVRIEALPTDNEGADKDSKRAAVLLCRVTPLAVAGHPPNS